MTLLILVDTPKLTHPRITRLTQKYFQGDYRLFANWYHKAFHAPRSVSHRFSPEDIADHRFTTSTEAVSIYKFQLEVIRQVFKKPSVDSLIRSAENSTPSSKGRRLYQCVLNTRRSLEDLKFRLRPNDWCIADNKTVDRINLDHVLQIKLALRYNLPYGELLENLERHYIFSHAESLIAKYSRYNKYN